MTFLPAGIPAAAARPLIWPSDPYSQRILLDNPTLYLPLDEPEPPVINYVGGSRSREPTPHQDWPQFGLSGSGVGVGQTASSWPGVSLAGINCRSDGSLTRSGAMTISVVVSPDASGPVLVKPSDGAGGDPFVVSVTWTKTVRVETSGGSVTSFSQLDPVNPSVIAFTWDPPGMSVLYINGVNGAASPTAAPWPSSHDGMHFHIGRSLSGQFSGRLAGFATFATALSPTTLKAHADSLSL